MSDYDLCWFCDGEGHESIKSTFDEYGHLDLSDVALDMELVEG